MATAAAGAGEALFDASSVPGAMIIGLILGRADLVDEVVIAGPDSGLKIYTRAKVRHAGESAQFVVAGVPPGHYFVTPMGPQGASLAARPPVRRVLVSAGMGARADFSLDGAR